MTTRRKIIGLSGGRFIAVVAAFLTACGQNLSLQVETDVPTALMQSLPLSVAVYYADGLRNHSYTENSKQRENWAIKTGSSQVAMFDRVLASTFAEVTPLTHLPSAGAPTATDLVIAPRIEEMQFATPAETFFDFYEAWIRYDIEILAPDGTSIDVWEIVAYGKSAQKRFTRRATGLNDAITLALRDAGAKFSTGIHRQPVVQRLLTRN